MKNIITLLMIAGSLLLFACNDNAEEVFTESIQNIEVGDQLNYAEADFPDRRTPKPNPL
jgi:hypothetical protein